jgi:hypothetical protein
MSEDYNYISWAIDKTLQLVFYHGFIIFPIGIVLNCFEIFIFQFKIFSKTTMGFYFSINCVLNIAVLLFLFIYTLLTFKYNVNLATMSSISCICYMVILRLIYQSMSWLNVFLTADRLRFVVFESRKMRIDEKRTFMTLPD